MNTYNTGTSPLSKAPSGCQKMFTTSDILFWYSFYALLVWLNLFQMLANTQDKMDHSHHAKEHEKPIIDVRSIGHFVAPMERCDMRISSPKRKNASIQKLMPPILTLFIKTAKPNDIPYLSSLRQIEVVSQVFPKLWHSGRGASQELLQGGYGYPCCRLLFALLPTGMR